MRILVFINEDKKICNLCVVCLIDVMLMMKVFGEREVFY